MVMSYRTDRGDGWAGAIVTGQERGPGRRAYAEVGIKTAREVPNFHPAAAERAKQVPTPLNAVDHRGFSEQWNEAHGDYTGSSPLTPHPTELFTHHDPQVTIAMSDPSLRHTVPTLIGLALHRDSPSVAAGKIVADDSLTAFSSRLSQRAARRGLPVVGHRDNPEMANVAGESLFPAREAAEQVIKERYPHESTPEEVTQARTWVREQLRPKRGTTPKPAPEPSSRVIQPALFDEDGKGRYGVSEAALGLSATGTTPGWKSMARVHDR